MNIYAKQKQTTATRNKLVVTNGEMKVKGQIRDMGLRDTNYYIQNR